MWFNFFKHKKDNSKTYEGRFITDDEISEMIKNDHNSLYKTEFKEINKMFDELKEISKYGR